MIDFLINGIPYLVIGVEIFLALLIGGRYFERKNNYIFRFSLSVALFLLISLLFSLLDFFTENSFANWWQIGFYVFVSALAVSLTFYCYQINVFNLFRYFCILLATRFLAVNLSNIIVLIFNQINLLKIELLQWVIRLLFVGLTYSWLYFVFLKNYKERIEEKIEKSAVVRFSIFFILTIFLESIKIAFMQYSSSYFIIFYFCAVVYCWIVLLIEYAIFNQHQTEVELDVVRRLWNEDKKHYTTQKETIDIINIKCHDFRHQLHSLRKSGNVTEQAIKDIEKSIKIYDSLLKTNNEVLDVILSNFYLRCQNDDILFTCMVDGEKLNFMEDIETYSFFGNMLENALEYEKTVFPKEKRFISLTTNVSNGFLSLQAENYFEGEPKVVENGTILTSKEDKNYHGFGMKSMKQTVEKYGGRFDVFVSDGIFRICTLFPLQTDRVKR